MARSSADDRGGEPRRLADAAAEHDQLRVHHGDDGADAPWPPGGPRPRPPRRRARRRRPRPRTPGAPTPSRASRPARAARTTAAADAAASSAPRAAGRPRRRLPGALGHRHVGDLAGHAVHAAVQLAADDQAHADAGADRDEGEACRPPGRARAPARPAPRRRCRSRPPAGRPNASRRPASTAGLVPAGQAAGQRDRVAARVVDAGAADHRLGDVGAADARAARTAGRPAPTSSATRPVTLVARDRTVARAR